MIRMMGLVDLRGIGAPVGSRTIEEDLTGNQKKLDVDKDGKIEGEDLAKLRTKKENLNEENPDNPDVVDDHEGQMAKADLMAINKHSKEIYNMLGDDEELEGWVQSKITKAAEYMNAVYNNMNYEKNKPGSLGDGEGTPADATDGMMPEGTHLNPSKDHKDPHKDPHLAHESICEGADCMDEVAPEGWEGTVKAMKKYKKIDNPWALAYYMKSKGYKSHKKDK
jgi:hypothetical protein